MTAWEEATLGDLGCVITGGTPPARNAHWFGDETPFITPTDIGEGDRRARPQRWLSGDGRVGLRGKLLPPGAVGFVCIGATIGKLCLTEQESVTNQQINSIVPSDHVDGRFLYYLLRHEASRIAQMAGGAATPIINKASFSGVTVRVPDALTMSSIGEFLGTIDDLIENNRRRVEVLEEMARAIYREWFVHFRFPGHESTTLVASALGPIPDDWEVNELREVAELTGGSTRTKASYVESGYVAFSAAGPDGYLPDFEIEGRGVVLSAVGARCGRTFRATGKWSSIANTIKIVPRTGVCGSSWLYLATGDPSIWPKRGSAQPFISINDARAVRVLTPDTATTSRFESACGSLDDAAERLRSEMTVLAQIRDLILPKLVTGLIDVSSLDLDALVVESVA